LTFFQKNVFMCEDVFEKGHLMNRIDF